MSLVRDDTGSWSESLEQWAQRDLASRAFRARSRFPFAPQHAPRPRLYDDLPVVLLVATRATSRLHQGLLDAVRLLQEATYGFRPLLVTDDVRSPVLRDYEWVVEHVMDEDGWHQLSPYNWLPMAADQLRWVQSHYGASAVYAPFTSEQSTMAIEQLARSYDAPRKVMATAARLAADAETSTRPQSHGLRGWWDAVPDGDSSVTAHVAGVSVEVSIHRGTGAGLLITVDPRLERAACEVAGRQGWSTVAIDRHHAFDAPAELVPRAVRAARDGLAGAGPTLLLTGEAGRLPSSAWDDMVDGVVDGNPAADEQVVRMDYGASLRFGADELPTVLAGIREVHRRSGPAVKTGVRSE